MIFIAIIHSIICLLLIAVILMQSGRGGGLTENFAAAETMFGAKTNEFMVRATAVLAVLFLITSLSLAHISSRKQQSLMERLMDKTNKPDIKINIPLDDKETKAGVNAVSPEVPVQKAAPSTPAPVSKSPEKTVPVPVDAAPVKK